MRLVGLTVFALYALHCGGAAEAPVAPLPRAAPAHQEPAPARFPIQATSRWIEHVDDGDEHLTLHWEDHCVVTGSLDASRHVVDCRSHNAEQKEPDSHDQMFTTADGGYGFIGNDAFGDWRVYDPPQIHLPGNARPGMSWEEDYKLGSDAKHRSYRIDAFARCVGHAVGVTVVQLSRTASGTTVEARQDYCEGVGMVGADVMVTRTNGTVRRSRIEPDTAAPK